MVKLTVRLAAWQRCLTPQTTTAACAGAQRPSCYSFVLVYSPHAERRCAGNTRVCRAGAGAHDIMVLYFRGISLFNPSN